MSKNPDLYKRKNHTPDGPSLDMHTHAEASRRLMDSFALAAETDNMNPDDIFIRIEALMAQLVVTAAAQQPSWVAEPELMVRVMIQTFAVMADNAACLAMNMLMRNGLVTAEQISKYENLTRMPREPQDAGQTH